MQTSKLGLHLLFTAVVLRQLAANLIPTVSGGAYQDARKVSIEWNAKLKYWCLPEFRCRTHQTRPSTLFSPIFSLAREKIGPPEARQKWPRRNEPPQATSVSSVLVSSFPNRKLNLRFGSFPADLRRPLSLGCAEPASLPLLSLRDISP